MVGGLSEGIIDQLNGLAGSDSAGNITVMQREVADMSLSSLDERIVSQILAMPGVESVSPSHGFRDQLARDAHVPRRRDWTRTAPPWDITR